MRTRRAECVDRRDVKPDVIPVASPCRPCLSCLPCAPCPPCLYAHLGTPTRWCGCIPSRPQDNWICVGPHYAEHLARTAPFNATRLLSQFPPGTRIFAEGNSWFGELVLTLICQSVDDPQLRVWNPIAAAGREAEHPFSVNHVAAWVEADVAIILLDNDDFWGTWGNSEFESHYEAHLGRVSGYGAPLPGT